MSGACRARSPTSVLATWYVHAGKKKGTTSSLVEVGLEERDITRTLLYLVVYTQASYVHTHARW